MIHNLHRAICIFVLISAAILFSRCQTEETEGLDNEYVVSEAKKWLEHNNLNFEAFAFTEHIDWGNAIVTNGTVGKSIEVPLILKANTNTNVVTDQEYKTHMRLLFIQGIDGTFNVFNVVYTTKDDSFNSSEKSFNILDIGSKYSGYITIQKSDTKIAFSGHYEKGKLLGLHNFDKDENKTNKLVCTYYVTVGSYTKCSSWVWYPDYSPGNLPPGYMPGISCPIYPEDPPPVDPCTAARNTSFIATDNGYLSAKAAIMQASADGNEHSITLGSAFNGEYTQSPMNNGGTNGVQVNQNWPGAFGAMHNHPNNSPLSSGDIYAAVTLNKNNSDFTTSFIFTGGETYAIVVTDLAAAKAFVEAYPADISPIYPPEFPQVIFDQIQQVRDKLGESNEGRTKGIALVLDNNNAGITLMKQDNDGNFKRIKIQQTTNSDGSVTFSPAPCN